MVRGTRDPRATWTVEFAVPATSGSPDPDAPPRAVADLSSARQLAATLGNAGLSARVEPVTTPPLADFAGGLLGYRVRVGSFPTKAGADAVVAGLPAGLTGSSVYTGWDGGSIAGVVHVRVVTIDPKRFTGRLISSFGPDIENRDTTSSLAARDGASVGVNGGYFVLDPLSGAPGDPAGIGVYRGRLLSEPVNGRPALVVRSNAGGTSVVRYLWNGLVRRAGQPGRSLVLDGVDRQPDSSATVAAHRTTSPRRCPCTTSRAWTPTRPCS